jgi:hypothetical protein
MPEWNAIVRKNLKNLRLTPQQYEEIAEELAGHLEDFYGQLRQQGLDESEALRLTLKEVDDWKGLARKIQDAKREEIEMNNRSKTLWLPGLMAFAASSILLMILQRVTMMRPELLVALEHIIPVHPTFWWKNQTDVIYLFWWVLLPLCGAAGAYLSRRTGGTRLTCAAASLFPSIVMFCIFSFILPVSMVVDKNSHVMKHPIYFVLAMVNWIMVPGLALLLGALPFLQRTKGIQQQ